MTFRKRGEAVTLEVDGVNQGQLLAKRLMPLTGPMYVGGLPMSVLSSAGYMSNPVSEEFPFKSITSVEPRINPGRLIVDVLPAQSIQ